MPLSEPGWWYADEPTLWARALSPVARVWGVAAERRYRQGKAFRSPLPVICIGNFTAGGTGKTPLAMYVAAELARFGASPVFLTRGYGGRHPGPHWVQPDLDGADDVGDEPLLLARVAPTLVSRDREVGARSIAAGEGKRRVIVMDDGLQNAALAKDLVLAVVDGRRGVGNGRIIPAGPLRAPLAFQLGLADAVIVNTPAHDGDPDAAAESPFAVWLRDHFGGPVLKATTRAAGDTSWLRDLPVVAFSGIGAPQRFFGLLERLGAKLVSRRTFADHHRFADDEAKALLADARAHGATLCTTEKDHVRLALAGGALGELRDASRVLPIRLDFGERDAVRLAGLLEASLVARSAPFA